jgi:DNA-directed RNA polymerase specialized sigma24 family protein
MKSAVEGTGSLTGRDLIEERVPAERHALEARATLIELERDEGQALFGFALRLGLSETESQDAVQETLLRLWAQLRAGATIDRPRNWTFRTIYRIAMDQHRLRRRAVSLLDRIRLSARPGPAFEPGAAVDVWPEVDRLTDRQRQVIYLRYQADLAFDEIGAVLGISASAARSHCTFGLSALRKRLHDEVPR